MLSPDELGIGSELSEEENLVAARECDPQEAHSQDPRRELEEAQSLIDSLIEKKHITFNEATLLRRFVQ